MSERTRGIIVKVLDMSELEAQALSYRQKGNGNPGEPGYMAPHPDCYEARIYGGKIAIAHSKKTGHLYTICTEGVGPEFGVTDDDPLYVEFHGSYHVRVGANWTDLSGNLIEAPIDPNRHTFDFMSFASATLSPADILEYPVAEEVDLADHIRTFGARLEGNFQMWQKVLS